MRIKTDIDLSETGAPISGVMRWFSSERNDARDRNDIEAVGNATISQANLLGKWVVSDVLAGKLSDKSGNVLLDDILVDRTNTPDVGVYVLKTTNMKHDKVFLAMQCVGSGWQGAGLDYEAIDATQLSPAELVDYAADYLVRAEISFNDMHSEGVF